MSRFTCCICMLAVLACAKPESKPAADTLGAGAPAPTPPTAISLANLAGTWAMRTMPEGKDTTLVTYSLVASADPAGWTLTFPNRKPIPVRVVEVAGDSIVFEAGPYESVLRKGVQVTTHSVSRLQDGRLVGSTIAHYKTTGADSVLNLRSEGTRAQ